MRISIYHQPFTIEFVGFCMLLLSMLGCAKEHLDSPDNNCDADYETETQIMFKLLIPNSTRTLESNATYQEMTINTLRLIVCDAETGNAVINKELMTPAEITISPDSTATYTVTGLKPENPYRLFVVANVPHIDLESITTESMLKEYLLNYPSKILKPNNLPMIFDGSEVSAFTISANAQEPLRMNIPLTYACIKLQLNVIFDKTDELSRDDDGNTVADNYKTNGFKPTKLMLKNVSVTAPLLISGGKDKVGGNVEVDLTNLGNYYTAWDYTNKNTNCKTGTVIENPQGILTNHAEKWLWQTTVYMLERYTDTDEEQLEFQLEGVLTDAEGNLTDATVKFNPCKIGVKEGNVKATDLPRGSFYEFIGRVVNMKVDEAKLKAFISLKDWVDVEMPIDFVHTNLILNKERGFYVNPARSDYIVYTADGTEDIKFLCETIIQDKPVIKAIPRTDSYTGSFFEISVNPEIDITDTLATSNSLQGTADAWLIAGNIKKKVFIDYDLSVK